jgi:mercuric reductase
LTDHPDSPAWPLGAIEPGGPTDPALGPEPIDDVDRPAAFTLMAPGWYPPEDAITQSPSHRRASPRCGPVLVAAGRHARVDGLDLHAAEVEVDEAGFVSVDASLRTTNSRVFAAGDVTGGPQFVYVAAAQSHLAATNALATSYDTIDYRGLPSVVFTDPQLASAGLTEDQAVRAGYDCDCRVIGLDSVPRALVEHDTRGAIKLVADRQTGKVLGVHALAAGAGDIVLTGVDAIKFGLTVEDLASPWAPYLTMSEALRLAAQSFTRPIDQLSCCAA